MSGGRTRRKLELGIALAGMLGSLIFFHYWVVKVAEPGIMSDLALWIFAAMGFVIGTMARMALNVFLDQDLRISPDVFRFQGKPYVALSNRLYGDLIEVKLSFELFEKRDEVDASFAGRLKHVEVVSLASVPARTAKKSHGRIYVEVPSKLLEEWSSSPNHRDMLYVRATSVHPTSNFRSITDAAVFGRASVFGDGHQISSESASRAGVIATDLAQAAHVLG